MHSKKLAAPLLGIFIAAATTGNLAIAEAPATQDKVIATVNGTNIKASDLGLYLRSKGPQAAGSTNPAALLEEVVNRELLKQEAIKKGIDKDENFQKAMELQRTNLLVNGLLSDTIDNADLSDEAVKKEYDEQIKNADLNEFSARHILVASEDEAKAAIKELADGADFAAVAKEKSTGPSGPNGGDLGWFQSGNMVPEFAEAVKAMKVGSVSKKPVKTEFGWHVIKLEDTRKVDPPSFEDSKNGVKNILANKAVQAHIEKLRGQAKIDIKKQ